MYFVISNNRAIGPFKDRQEAYEYAASKDWDFTCYLVKSDRVCQQDYLHLPIEKPD